MRTKKAILPILAGTLIMSLGLGACGSEPEQGSKSGDVTSSVTDNEVKINVTAAGDKKDLIVGETVQLSADQQGVTWSTRNNDIVSVSETGLVTALAAGSARISAKKDGFATGSITINVQKAPEKAAKYVIDLENADHYNPNDFWGMSFGGTTYGPGDSPVEDNNGATEDGKSLGWLTSGCKETLTFTANKAVQVEIGVSMAYNSQMDLASVMSVTFNGAAIDMAGKVLDGPEDGQSYYDWHTVSFGNVTLNNGSNVLTIEMLAQGPNMNEFKIYTEETIDIQVVKPVVMKKIVATVEESTITAGETAQITTETEGVTYTSDNEEVATVSATGLISAVAAGKANITVSKEGMKPVTIAITVIAPRETVDYVLVAGEAVRMEAENGEFYCDAGQWGYPQWGIGPSHDGGITPIEDVESASGGMSLGWLNQSSKVTIKFTSPKAGTANLKLCGAGAQEFVLADTCTIKVNDTPVDLTDKVIEAGEGGVYTDWKVVDLGNVAVANGENSVALEITAQQGFNLDYFEFTLAA